MIKLFLLFIVGIVVLSYFGINVREILDSPLVRDNFLAVYDFASNIWVNYGEPIISKIFDFIISLIGKSSEVSGV